jgi:predicted Fe-Mo cluster-binding NifX family protein
VERNALDERGFAVERLGIGDWPDVTVGAGGVISYDDWVALADGDSRIGGAVVFAFDVSPMRTSASIVAAGRRDDGRYHVEVVEHRSGTAWVVPRMKELVEKHGPRMVLCDGPARALSNAMASEGVEVHETTGTEYAQACGLIVDAVAEKNLRHLATPELGSAVRGADTSPLGDAWKWSRRRSTADITPLVAATLALWAASQQVDGDALFDWSKVAGAAA